MTNQFTLFISVWHNLLWIDPDATYNFTYGNHTIRTTLDLQDWDISPISTVSNVWNASPLGIKTKSILYFWWQCRFEGNVVKLMNIIGFIFMLFAVKVNFQASRELCTDKWCTFCINMHYFAYIKSKNFLYVYEASTKWQAHQEISGKIKVFHKPNMAGLKLVMVTL